jgi:hypothetical protein
MSLFEGARHIGGETVPVLGIVKPSLALQPTSRTKHDDQEGDRVRLVADYRTAAIE